MREFIIKYRPLITYFILSYFISWLIFVRLALNHHGIIFLFEDTKENTWLLNFWHSLGGLGPIIAAILTIRFSNNQSEWKRFLGSYSIKKISFKGWIWTLTPLFLFIFGIILNKIINQEWYSLSGFYKTNNLDSTKNLFFWCLPLVTYGFGEEGGWRGFAIPFLQKKFNAFSSSTILAVFWIGWHIPTFFYRYEFNPVMLAGFIVGIYAGAILLTFLFNYTDGSLLAASIWHLTFNFVSMLSKDNAVMSASMSVIIILISIIITIHYGVNNLSPKNRITTNDSI
jgi:membrane protease YdiL (CAAX protease family)